MEFNRPGCVPQFGAIFMSNTGTKEECFRRKLFGLPFGLAPFVEHVKAGMILFLFEFERRELHGVYQASSDGAMNIVPHAYISSGKQFPAQVNFTDLWHCSPLSENEFKEAIRENYYSSKKFNFGLSEVQVHNLLYLFHVKKIKPQRDFSSCLPYDPDDPSILPISYIESRGATCPTFSSVLAYDAPMPSNHYGNSQTTTVPFLEASSAENMAKNLPENKGHMSLSLPRSSPDPFSYFGNRDGVNVGTYLSSRSQYPSFVFDSRCHGAPQGKNDQQMLQYGTNFNEGKNQLQGLDYPVKSSDTDYHDNSGDIYSDCQMNVGTYSFSPSQFPLFVFDSGCHEASPKNGQQMQHGVNFAEGRNQQRGLDYPVKFSDMDYCDNSGATYSDCQKNQKKKSVFSRLALAPEAGVIESDNLLGVDEDNLNTSVDDVMSMLHQGHYQWLKKRKCRQTAKVGTTDFQKKKKNISDSKMLKDHAKKVTDEVRLDDITSVEEDYDKSAKAAPFVDFKRRSELRKGQSDSKINACGLKAESEGSAGGLQRKRKLIRPNFSKNELIDGERIDVCKEAVAGGCEGCKLDIQQTEEQNAVLSSGCEVITGDARQSEARKIADDLQRVSDAGVNDGREGNYQLLV